MEELQAEHSGFPQHITDGKERRGDQQTTDGPGYGLPLAFDVQIPDVDIV